VISNDWIRFLQDIQNYSDLWPMLSACLSLQISLNTVWIILVSCSISSDNYTVNQL
jgi:hypothetical protein